MDKSKMVWNCQIYYWYQLFLEPLFWGPILIAFIIDKGHMSLGQIYFMEAVSILIMVVLEPLSGSLSDLIGRKKTVVLGAGILAVKTFAFAVASSPLGVWIANLMWVVGFSMISGADESLLADSILAVNGKNQSSHEIRKIVGQSVANRFWLIAICSVLVGYLAEINIRLPLFLSGIPMTINFVVTWFFTEPPMSRQSEENAKKHNFKIYGQIFISGFRFVMSHPKIKWIMAYVSVVSVVSKLWFFTYNPYFKIVDLPLRYYGWLFFAMNIIAAIFSHQANWLVSKIGEFKSVVLMVIVTALPILAMGFWVMPLAVLFTLWQNIVRGYIKPLIAGMFHPLINSHHRATVASIKSASLCFTQFLGMLTFSWLTAKFTVPECLQYLGLFMVIAGVLLIIDYGRYFRKK